MEKKIARIREEIAQLKKNEEIADLLTLFREKGEIQKLADFELDNPRCIWHYFCHVSLDLGFPPGTIDILLNDVREIAIRIMDNPPNSVYSIVMLAGMYNPKLTGYKGGHPEREQHVWHMLLWFFAESESDIINAIVRRFVDLCNETKLLGYHERMIERLNRQGLISEEELKVDVKEILTDYGKENAPFIKRRLKSIAAEIGDNKVDYLFVELALYALNYINEERKHKSFIKALEAWGIIKPGFIKDNNLSNKLSRDLHNKTIREIDDWDVKSRNKFYKFYHVLNKKLTADG